MLFKVGDKLASDLRCQTFSEQARKRRRPVWDEQYPVLAPHKTLTQQGRQVDWCSQGAAALCGSGES